MSSDDNLMITIGDNSAPQDKENLAKVLQQYGREVTKLKRKTPKMHGYASSDVDYSVKGKTYNLQYSLVKLSSEEGKEVWAVVSYAGNKEKYKKGEGGLGIVYKIKNIVEYDPSATVPITIKGAEKSRYVLKRFEKQLQYSEPDSDQNLMEEKESEISKQAFDDVYANTITLHDGSTQFHLLMPLLKKTLKEVKDDNLNSTQQATLALASLKALQHFRKETKHNHNDIKPENLMLTAAKQVTLIDFGTASKFDSAPLTGTLNYMAPDASLGLFEGEKIDWGLADVFSMGVTLGEVFGYKVFTEIRDEGPPLSRPKEAIIWSSIVKGSHLDKCAQEQLTILKEMTEMDPSKRINLDEAIKRYEIVVLNARDVNDEFFKKIISTIRKHEKLNEHLSKRRGNRSQAKSTLMSTLYDIEENTLKLKDTYSDKMKLIINALNDKPLLETLNQQRYYSSRLFSKVVDVLDSHAQVEYTSAQEIIDAYGQKLQNKEVAVKPPGVIYLIADLTRDLNTEEPLGLDPTEDKYKDATYTHFTKNVL